MITVQNVQDGMDLFIRFANVVVLLYALYKFLGKPRNALEERVKDTEKRLAEHDGKFKDIDDSLHKGNDKFREQEDTNSVFKRVMLLFVNFEIAFCQHTNYAFTEDLEEAKDELQDYLTDKKSHRKGDTQ